MTEKDIKKGSRVELKRTIGVYGKGKTGTVVRRDTGRNHFVYHVKFDTINITAGFHFVDLDLTTAKDIVGVK